MNRSQQEEMKEGGSAETGWSHQLTRYVGPRRERLPFDDELDSERGNQTARRSQLEGDPAKPN